MSTNQLPLPRGFIVESMGHMYFVAAVFAGSPVPIHWAGPFHCEADAAAEASHHRTLNIAARRYRGAINVS